MAELDLLIQRFPSELLIRNILADVHYRALAWEKALQNYYPVLKSDAPNAYQLEEAYSKAARCTKRARPGDKAALLAAIDLAKEGLRRFPESKMLKGVLEGLVGKQHTT